MSSLSNRAQPPATAVVPRLGNWVIRAPDVFAYLRDSLLEFPDPKAVKRIFEQVGFTDVGCRRLTLGTASIHLLHETAARAVTGQKARVANGRRVASERNSR